MSTKMPAVSTQNTLSKAAAHLRWLVEKSGVNPEGVFVAIVVNTDVEREKLEAQLKTEFDPATMTRGPHRIIAHGVKIAVTKAQEAA